jgi:hypothetical protein
MVTNTFTDLPHLQMIKEKDFVQGTSRKQLLAEYRALGK